jgi:drug/metabolite transporter (DMT)-like permease
MQDFFNALFDFSFKEFVTIKIIKVIYGIGIFFAAIGALAVLVKGFQANFLLGILALLLTPVVFIIYTILVRVYLEVVIVLFRISEDVRTISELKKG